MAGETTEALAIRPARAADAERVAVLAAQLGYPLTVEAITERMAIQARDPQRTLMVACRADDGLVIAWLELEIRETFLGGRISEVRGLVVDATVRRSGAGRALIAWAEAETRRRGLDELVLRSNAQRVEAGHFYPALGFSIEKLSRVFRKRLGT